MSALEKLPTQGAVDPRLQLLSISQCCELLGVSRWQLYKLMNSRQLPSVHLNRRHLVRASDLAAFIEGLSQGGV